MAVYDMTEMYINVKTCYVLVWVHGAHIAGVPEAYKIL